MVCSVMLCESIPFSSWSTSSVNACGMWYGAKCMLVCVDVMLSQGSVAMENSEHQFILLQKGMEFLGLSWIEVLVLEKLCEW